MNKAQPRFYTTRSISFVPTAASGGSLYIPSHRHLCVCVVVRIVSRFVWYFPCRGNSEAWTAPKGPKRLHQFVYVSIPMSEAHQAGKQGRHICSPISTMSSPKFPRTACWCSVCRLHVNYLMTQLRIIITGIMTRTHAHWKAQNRTTCIFRQSQASIFPIIRSPIFRTHSIIILHTVLHTQAAIFPIITSPTGSVITLDGPK